MMRSLDQQFKEWNLQLSEYLKKDEHLAEFIVGILTFLYAAGAVAYNMGEWVGENMGSLLLNG